MSEPGGFLALEMEEVESLVGNGSRQKLGNLKRSGGNSIHGNKVAAESCLASCVSSRNFLPKCVVMACLALLALLIISAKDEKTGGGVSIGDIEEKSPVPAPTLAPSIAPQPTEPPIDEAAKKKAEDEAAAAAAKKTEEEAAAKKKAEEEAAAKKKAEEEAAAKKKAEEEAAAKKKAEEEAAAKKKAEEEAAAKKKAEEETAAKKKAEEEAAAKKKAEEEAATKKKAEEEAAAKKKAEEETAAKKKAEEEAAAKKAAEPRPTAQPTEPPKESFYYSNRATIPPLIDHPFPDDKTKELVSEKFGKWKFWDGDEENRPLEDYCGKYPNRDIPGDDFPDEAWQGDAVYVNHILNDGDLLVARAMEAIFTEYGHGKPLEPEQMAERMKMFHWTREDLSTATEPPAKYRANGDRGNGGWTTTRSFRGLVRRMLHAMMTQDTFTIVMGGHSAAAGQGNHFRQSYMMQAHKVLYPVFARMGVKLITRNMAQGGLGTVQAGMGLGSIYGDDIDLLLWDSGKMADDNSSGGNADGDDEWMTENDKPEHIDIFFRQALLSGRKVPVIWGGPFELLRMLHEEADVDVGDWGLATDGIIETESAEQAKAVPWAARYMKCKPGAEDLCNQEPRFCAPCWIDRADKIKPEAKQLDHPKGQVKWHPGWRAHQLTGRNIAFAVLEALQAAINIWNEGVMGGPPLDEEMWHVTAYYENIRAKVKNLDKKLGKCYGIEGSLPTRMCNTPMKAYTQYTPRANYYETSLSSIIKAASDGYVPSNDKKALYEGPDAPNKCVDVPEDTVDVFNVVTGRRRLNEEDFALPARFHMTSMEPHLSNGSGIAKSTSTFQRRLDDTIIPGTGWEIWDEPQGLCDGTYSAQCNRYTKSDCVLSGHHDARGAIIGNEFSGWLVMNLKDLKEGVIVIKLHTWHTADESTRTNGWTAVNNGKRQRRRLREANMPIVMPNATSNDDQREGGLSRALMRSYDTPSLPDGFKFEYAVDGKITSLDKHQFLEKKKQIQRVVETITLLDDPNFTKEAKDVELAIRLKGGGRDVVFGLSHVYYA